MRTLKKLIIIVPSGAILFFVTETMDAQAFDLYNLSIDNYILSQNLAAYVSSWLDTHDETYWTSWTYEQRAWYVYGIIDALLYMTYVYKQYLPVGFATVKAAEEAQVLNAPSWADWATEQIDRLYREYDLWPYPPTLIIHFGVRDTVWSFLKAYN